LSGVLPLLSAARHAGLNGECVKKARERSRSACGPQDSRIRAPELADGRARAFVKRHQPSRAVGSVASFGALADLFFAVSCDLFVVLTSDRGPMRSTLTQFQWSKATTSARNDCT
jgi:hypothetical protein